ncbi:hypothetical protein BV25DRAFT_1820660 [Artomyces pyxidatus]|uniref:Uncharacterized protein n=1 Tax=Artomyces pyxidatus TaxID=48021 RepID=A0ACB8TDW8_9AGAM|nr:hypothetical protein BV25DRAFT_1820660 [Artomyces pyxidatus]
MENAPFEFPDPQSITGTPRAADLAAADSDPFCEQGEHIAAPADAGRALVLAWLTPAVQGLVRREIQPVLERQAPQLSEQDLHEKLSPILEEALRPLTQRINAMEARLLDTTRMAVVAINQECLDGSIRPFAILPFPDGSDPTAPPIDLPPLRCANDVKGLTAEQAHAYAVGYRCSERMIRLNERQAIFNAIGGRVLLR